MAIVLIWHLLLDEPLGIRIERLRESMRLRGGEASLGAGRARIQAAHCMRPAAHCIAQCQQAGSRVDTLTTPGSAGNSNSRDANESCHRNYSDPRRGHQTATNAFNFAHTESRSSESASRKSDRRLDLAIV